MAPNAPTWNAKCIVFTLALAGGYWFLPPKNKWILLALLYFPYLAMYWYDAHYNCDLQLGATFLHHFYAWGKGKHYHDSWKGLEGTGWQEVITAVDLIILVVAVAVLTASEKIY